MVIILFQREYKLIRLNTLNIRNEIRCDPSSFDCTAKVSRGTTIFAVIFQLGKLIHLSSSIYDKYK